MLPNAGLGAANAMLDAVILANALFEIREPSSSNIQGAFKEYYTERYSRAQADFQTSKQTAQIISGQVSSATFFFFFFKDDESDQLDF